MFLQILSMSFNIPLVVVILYFDGIFWIVCFMWRRWSHLENNSEFCFQRQGAQIKTFLRVKTIDRLKSSYKFAYLSFGGVKSFYFPRLRKKNKRRLFLSRFHENTADCFKDSRKLIHYFFETWNLIILSDSEKKRKGAFNTTFNTTLLQRQS